MRVLFLTSNEHVRGITSDDGFEIGRISFDTIVLLVFTSILGAIAGGVYGLLRIILRGPRWLRAAGVGVATAAGAGGGVIVKAEGVDFVFLEPLWLAVALFLVIPGAWGMTVVLLTERLLRTIPSSNLPTQIGTRYGGPVASAAGWLFLGAITAAGLTDLAADLSELT